MKPSTGSKIPLFKKVFNALLRRTAVASALLGGLAVVAFAVGVWRLCAPIEKEHLVESTAMATLMDLGQSIRANVARVVTPAIERTQKLSVDPGVIAAVKASNAQMAAVICNKAITASTEIDAVALFGGDGNILAINTVYASGKPIDPARVQRVLGRSYEGRPIIRSCAVNGNATSALEFQTTCDVTPVLFDSSGLSVAYSAPIFDPQTAHRIGVVSSRLRFDRLSDLVKGRTIPGTDESVSFVTDRGAYFSEEINSGRQRPPVDTHTLAAIVVPLVNGQTDYSFTQQDGDYLGLFRLRDFTTIQGGGIQILIKAKGAWLAREAWSRRLLQVSVFVVLGFVLGLLATLLWTTTVMRKMHSRTSETLQRLNQALDAGHLSSWDWDIESDIVAFDRRFAVQLGLDPDASTLSVESLVERCHPDDVPAIRKALTEMTSGGSSTFISEHRMKHTDRNWRWMSITGTVVVRDEKGKPTRSVGTQEDITARKVTQSALAQSQKLESIGQLAAGIAHEINTPIQYVGDNIRFLQTQFDNLLKVVSTYERMLNLEEPMPWERRRVELANALKELDFNFMKEEIPAAIRQSIEGVNRVAMIVRAMKDFSHPGSDTKGPADLNRSILSTIEVCRAIWKYVAEVETDLAEDLPMVPCLVAEFNQVILNLIVNAADAIAQSMGPGGSSGADLRKGLIRVTTRALDGSVEVCVSDNGAGIPDAIKSRMFEQFFTTKPVGKGTGQGLALSRNVIVGKHGGTINFESQEGRGTKFIVQLPVAGQIEEGLKAA